MDTSHFRFTYENDENFAPFPINAVTVCHRGPFADGDFSVPGLPAFNPMMLLHGEEEVTIHAPLMVDTKYTVKESIADVQDKGKGGLLIFDSEIYETETNKLQSVVRSSLFVRGLGGFGHKGTIKQVFPKPPKRAPDMSKEEATSPNQAVLYRLCNDRNPLHIDPQMAAMGNFDKPILHGLCFKGITARSLQQHFFKDAPEKMKSMNVRFTAHVFPGETLVVNAWKEGNQLIFATQTKDRKTTVLMGYMNLVDE